MAYIMNPNSYRIGYSLAWSDSWYSNKKVYPVILQNIINIRNFIIYYLTRGQIEQLDIYLSNINILIKKRTFINNILFLWSWLWSIYV